MKCPRCGHRSLERFYGPCTPCRADLRIFGCRQQVKVEAAEYEPKMNVVPNAVAMKEDW